ncbi:hypothetical protein [Actinomyces radicidentis]|uniref:hypothetical protein n=1 Tax=Actinomyces radicidentis TaxID=111015 RepID=UPI0028EFFD98|nr:hypothetical protein [Actinomyces radicidentis]
MDAWDWDLAIATIGVALTALIPIGLGILDHRQKVRDDAQRELQTRILQQQSLMLTQQRRDTLLASLGAIRDPNYLKQAWEEIKSFSPEDQVLLRAAFRHNSSVALPGTTLGIKIADRLDTTSYRDYFDSLDERYATPSPYREFDGLLDFLTCARNSGCDINSARVSELVSGPDALIQHPSHSFFRELVTACPEVAGSLLHSLDTLDPTTPNGLALNILTGVTLAAKDTELKRTNNATRMGAQPDERAKILQESLPASLATLFHRNRLSNLADWTISGSTEPTTATGAWLTRTVGWICKDDSDHLSMHMIENLATTIRSIPETGWGVDEDDIATGFAMIARKCPALWKQFGPDTRDAASKIGKWQPQAPPDRDV